MQKRFDAAMILVVGGIVSTTGWACSDKLILTIGNVRFSQIYTSPRPPAILAYGPRNSPVAQVVQELEQQSAGKRAGLTFFYVDDRARLDQVLRTQKFDLLLVDSADADALQQEAQTVPSKPVV